MKKKLIKIDNNFALIFDKSMLSKLGINDDTEIDVSYKDKCLVIKPIKMIKKRNSKKTEDEKIRKIGKEIMTQYKETFKKLAKT